MPINQLNSSRSYRNRYRRPSPCGTGRKDHALAGPLVHVPRKFAGEHDIGDAFYRIVGVLDRGVVIDHEQDAGYRRDHEQEE